MKEITNLLLVSLAVLLINCKKNDDTVIVDPEVIDKPEPEPENQAPNIFDLLEVEDMAIDVSLMPSFKWNTSTDPDGDMINYDLLLGKNESALTAEATGLNTALFNVDDRLSLFTEYFWQVNAKDGKGKETSSDTFSFTTRNLNVPDAANAENLGFSARNQHTVTFFKDRLLLIGGINLDKVEQDIHQSTNGIDWDEGAGELPAARTGHSTVVFNDTLWVLGGKAFPSGITRRNQLYGSTDGLNFINGFNGPWSGREQHTSVVFKDKVWILGGIDVDDNPLNDVWSATDVKTWDPDSQETANWDGRYGHSSVVFDDKLWVIGGFNGTSYLNEVWYTDGTTESDGTLKWEFVPQENSFPARISHKTVVHDNKIWLMGGNDAASTKNDIWYSEDGANWIALNQDANFIGRKSPTLTVFENKLLLIGGFGGGEFHNDVWVFD